MSPLASPPLWNKSELSALNRNNIVLHRHPLLYGAAIYALLLIIVGTIGTNITGVF